MVGKKLAFSRVRVGGPDQDDEARGPSCRGCAPAAGRAPDLVTRMWVSMAARMRVCLGVTHAGRLPGSRVELTCGSCSVSGFPSRSCRFEGDPQIELAHLAAAPFAADSRGFFPPPTRAVSFRRQHEGEAPISEGGGRQPRNRNGLMHRPYPNGPLCPGGRWLWLVRPTRSRGETFLPIVQTISAPRCRFAGRDARSPRAGDLQMDSG